MAQDRTFRHCSDPVSCRRFYRHRCGRSEIVALSCRTEDYRAELSKVAKTGLSRAAPSHATANGPGRAHLVRLALSMSANIERRIPSARPTLGWRAISRMAVVITLTVAPSRPPS